LIQPFVLSHSKPKLNTLTSGLIQTVRKKTADSHMALHRIISTPVRVTDLVKFQKTQQVF